MWFNIRRARPEELRPHYNLKAFDWMAPFDPERIPRSDPDVESPPALWVRHDDGSTFTLGFDPGGWPTGLMEFDVVRNGRKTGEKACKIVKKNGKVRIYGQDRWRTWNGRQFV